MLSIVAIFAIIALFDSVSQAQDIVITEIMFNPNGNENAREFVEIFNRGNEDVSIEGYLIGDGTGFDTIVPTPAGSSIVPAGSYALILDPDYFTAGEEYALIPMDTALFTVNDRAIGQRGLSNSTAEPISLISPAGDTLSVVTYSLKCDAGHSWERILIERDNSADNFSQSKETHGTPGYENSVTPPLLNPALDESSLRIEPPEPSMNTTATVYVSYKNQGRSSLTGVRVSVTILPDIAVGLVVFDDTVPPGQYATEIPVTTEFLPGGRLEIRASVLSMHEQNDAADDTTTVLTEVSILAGTIILNEVMAAPSAGNPEWIELYNRGSRPVDLFQWRLSDNSAGEPGIIGEHMFVPSKGYALISDVTLNETNSPGMRKDTPVLVINSFPSLNNDGDIVRLFDFNGEPADSMSYDDTTPGYSFELISLAMPHNDERWDISVDNAGGTPGAVNSIAYADDNARPNSAKLTANPNPFSERTAVSYSLPFPVARVNLYVYDRQGRLVVKIRDGEESGSDWTGEWNGHANGETLTAGPYILILEALDKRTGNVAAERMTIVLGRNL